MPIVDAVAGPERVPMLLTGEVDKATKEVFSRANRILKLNQLLFDPFIHPEEQAGYLFELQGLWEEIENQYPLNEEKKETWEEIIASIRESNREAEERRAKWER